MQFIPFSTSLYAQPVPSGGAPEVTATTAPAPTKGGEAAGPAPSGITTLLFPILLIGIFYFLLIRPQQKKEKNRQAMLKKLSKGDKVVTRGGLVGVVSNVKNENGIALIKVADNIRLEVMINAIEVVNPTNEEMGGTAEAPKNAKSK